MSKTKWTVNQTVDAETRTYDDGSVYDSALLTYDGIVSSDLVPKKTTWTTQSP